jgi:hydrogenase maturation protein HypF
MEDIFSSASDGGSRDPLDTTLRLRVELRGAVQGIGFRPFVYRLATELSLRGWVANDSQGLVLEVEGRASDQQLFVDRLKAERPGLSILRSIRVSWLPSLGFEGFEIRESLQGDSKSASMLPDIATCEDCRRELFDRGNRRYRYPFINCTNCGPRYSIIEELPYDRKGTTMKDFAMCPECSSEYADPRDRRFHAQPDACGRCGPAVALWSAEGDIRAAGEESLALALRAIESGKILAMKGLGGFLLLVDAANEEAVAELRLRKNRPTKPFAVMAMDLEAAAELVILDEAIAAALASPEAPIVLATKRSGAPIAESVAPGNPNLGLMLPYSPLHHLVARDFGRPLVATSGNLGEEPICVDETEALSRLRGIADLFLVHDRPIARHADDSVAWVTLGKTRLLRRARGYAPLPLELPASGPTILGVGAQQKSSVALSVGDELFVSQHIGDLVKAETAACFERVVADLASLYGAEPEVIACDLNPDYYSTQWALSQEPVLDGRKPVVIRVQHHHAHLAACLAENRETGKALGVIWDGSGYGGDGTAWGGEFLAGDSGGFSRIGHLAAFRLLGGEAAVREPRRSGLALLWELYGEELFERSDLALVANLSPEERSAFGGMLRTGLCSPSTTSAGRLFDGVAAILGFDKSVSFEGEAAMTLEYAADASDAGAYPFGLVAQEGSLVLDWKPIVEALIADLNAGRPTGSISARFHGSLAASIVAMADRAGEETVALSGGCFQNRRLLEQAARGLERSGHRVLLHERFPPNDGCLALGQVAVALAVLKRSREEESRARGGVAVCASHFPAG